ncbi:hypothetical protein [Methylobacterium sp. WSM2598]|uniref:hypothetical protein n=1 Tax=Methylobacterium sp. WSM2598 TaxID=398261 RepID=UPI0003754BFD|nr:hypothetical protein [Methylobacterium sp. WSM2598]
MFRLLAWILAAAPLLLLAAVGRLPASLASPCPARLLRLARDLILHEACERAVRREMMSRLLGSAPGGGPARHAARSDLVENRWIHLVRITPEGRLIRYRGGGLWEPDAAAVSGVPESDAAAAGRAIEEALS